jgi:hypothetical protein
MAAKNPSIQDEIAFLLQREKDERRLSAEASDVCARNAHWSLAEHYADQARALSEIIPRVSSV